MDEEVLIYPQYVKMNRNLMYIFLHGQDTYRSRQKLQEVVASYKEKNGSGLNMRFLSADNLRFQDFFLELQNVPMFQEKKLLVLNGVFQNPEFRDSFLKNSQRLSNLKDIVIFYEDSAVPAKEPLFKFLSENGKTQEFKNLEGQKLRNWAKREFKNSGAEIDSAALETIISYVGNDLWRFSNEINKLAAFKKNKTIVTDDIRLLVKPKIEMDVFKTIRALADRNKKQALALLHRHLERGDNPLYLLSMVNYQFRTLLARRSSYLFSPGELKSIYHKLLEADLKIKTGQLDPQMALDLFIAEI